MNTSFTREYVVASLSRLTSSCKRCVDDHARYSMVYGKEEAQNWRRDTSIQFSCNCSLKFVRIHVTLCTSWILLLCLLMRFVDIHKILIASSTKSYSNFSEIKISVSLFLGSIFLEVKPWIFAAFYTKSLLQNIINPDKRGPNLV